MDRPAVRETVARSRQGREGDFEGLYRKLNRQQQKAVDAIEGPVMVLAGPGTGKTQVLAARIARILQQTQMDPWNILCLTFTESAVAAMRQRLIGIIGRAAYQVRIHTFHSFCNDIIQENPEKFAAARDWQALGDIERVDLFRELIDELPGASPLKPFGDPYMYVPTIIQNVQLLKREAIRSVQYLEFLEQLGKLVQRAKGPIDTFAKLSPSARTDKDCAVLQAKLARIKQELKLAPSVWAGIQKAFDRYRQRLKLAEGKREAGKVRTKLKNDIKHWFERIKQQLPRQKAFGLVYERYQEKLTARGRYDYEDMVMQVVDYLKTDDDLLGRYQEEYQYILVDEYQDTNSAQNEVLKLLGSYYPNPNIFVVGDNKQSIYRFQGASLENLLFFYELYREHVQIISLTRNYRSTPVILEAAGAVIAHNTESVSAHVPEARERLEAAAEGKNQPLEILEADSEEDENYVVAKKIGELIKSGVSPEEIAVLYRYHRDQESLRDAMARLEVPVRVEAGEDALSDRKVAQWLALLRYLDDPGRDDLLAQIIEQTVWRFDPVDVLRVIHLAGERRLSLLRVISSREHLDNAGAEHPEAFLDFARRLARWRQLSANVALEQLLSTVLHESGWLAHVLGDNVDIGRLQKLSRIFMEARRLNQADGTVSLREFIRQIDVLREHRIGLSVESWQMQHKTVRLMTAHKVKGQEFDHVFIIRLVDRHWGNVRERSRLPLPHGLLVHDPVVGQENNEDERRLFYVALTRARCQVHITYARHSLEGREQVPSLFVEEIPDELVERREERLERSMVPQIWSSHLSPVIARAEDTGGVEEWLRGRLEHYVMSVTHLNNYLECPRKFYYRNLLQVPATKTKALAFGTAVHNVLRDFFLQWHEGKTMPGEGWMAATFIRHLNREVMSEAERADSMIVGQKVLREYFERYASDFISDSLVEYDFRGHGVVIESVPITGKLDKVEIVDKSKKYVNIVDYKTGNPDNAREHLKPGGTYRRQLAFYKLLCDFSPRFEYEMASGEIDFVQPASRTGMFVKRRFEITPAELDDLAGVVKRVWQEIGDLEFLQAAGCGKCEYCAL